MKFSIQSHEDPNTVILDASLIDQLTRGNIIDAPITLLRQDPPVWILPTAMQQNGDIFLSHTFVKGYWDDLSDAEYMVRTEHELFSIPEHLKGKNNGRHWITNLYHTDEGVLAFLHSEYTGENDHFGMPGVIFEGAMRSAPGRSAISLAWLPIERLQEDEVRFEYLGHIANYCSEIPHFNVSGTPIFTNSINGVEYMNIMFTNIETSADEQGVWRQRIGYVSQARAPLKEIIKGAKKGYATKWVKRNGNIWTDSLLPGSTPALPRKLDYTKDKRIRAGAVIVHSDVRFFKEVNKYILISYVHKFKDERATQFVIYSSKNGVEWEFETTSSARNDCIGGWSYIKIFREGRRNGDDAPYIIVGWDYGKPGRCVYRLNLHVSND